LYEYTDDDDGNIYDNNIIISASSSKQRMWPRRNGTWRRRRRNTYRDETTATTIVVCDALTHRSPDINTRTIQNIIYTHNPTTGRQQQQQQQQQYKSSIASRPVDNIIIYVSILTRVDDDYTELVRIVRIWALCVGVSCVCILYWPVTSSRTTMTTTIIY